MGAESPPGAPEARRAALAPGGGGQAPESSPESQPQPQQVASASQTESEPESEPALEAPLSEWVTQPAPQDPQSVP